MFVFPLKTAMKQQMVAIISISCKLCLTFEIFENYLSIVFTRIAKNNVKLLRMKRDREK